MRFSLALFLTECLFFFAVVPSNTIFALTSLEEKTLNFYSLDTNQYSHNELLKYQYVQNFLIQIVENYNKKNFKQAILLTKNAHRLVKELPNYRDLSQIFISIENIININAKKNKVRKFKKHQKKLHWEIDEIGVKDQSRYSFAIWTGPHFNNFQFGNKKNIFRSGLGGTLEYFFPYFEKSLGISINYMTNFLNFNEASLTKNYLVHEYNAFFQYRLVWKLPAIDQAATLTIKLGAKGHFVQEFIIGNFPIKEPKSYTTPHIGVSIQDPLLNRIFQNQFNKNLIFSMGFFIEYLPITNERLVLGANLGLYYRFSHFLLGPQYEINLKYVKQESFKHNSRIAFILSAQL